MSGGGIGGFIIGVTPIGGGGATPPAPSNKPTTFVAGKFLIGISNEAVPEQFIAPCGLTTKGFNQTVNLQEWGAPDRNNPDAPAPIGRSVVTRTAEITGSGVLAGEAFGTWQQWYDRATPKRCRLYPMGSDQGYYSGTFILSAFQMAVSRGQKVNVDLSMLSAGAYAWIPLPS